MVGAGEGGVRQPGQLGKVGVDGESGREMVELQPVAAGPLNQLCRSSVLWGTEGQMEKWKLREAKGPTSQKVSSEESELNQVSSI